MDSQRIEVLLRMLTRRPGILTTLTALLVVFASTAWITAGGASAQAVEQYVQMEAPTRTVAHDVSVLREDNKPRIALFRSNQTSTYVPNGEAVVRDAVYFWELLLLGLRLQYQILDDRDLSGNISDDFRVIILPGVESMSERQRRRVIDFLKDGGGVIASGRTGVFDEKGARVGGAFFQEAFGVTYLEDLPAQPFGILQSIDGNTPIGDGVPMGYQLNVAPQLPMAAVRPDSNQQAVGRVITYNPSDQGAFDGATLLLYGTNEKGRFLWSRFHPHDISREPEQQEMYQLMIVNALADLAGATTVSVGPWPNGNPMAMSVVSLPTVGFDALSYLTGLEHYLDILESQRVPATFFFTGTEISAFPDLYGRAIKIGEIGVGVDSDHVLKEQPYEVQRQRMLQSLRELGLEDPHGLYPPGGFYDGNTIRAMDDINLDYMVLLVTRGLSPGNINWWSEVDYREGLLLSDLEVDTAPLFVPGQTLVATAPSGPVVPSPVIAISIVDGLAPTFEKTYEIVRGARGMYVLPYYSELYGTRSVRSIDFEATLDRAQREGSWITTTSEIIRWWRVRTNIRPMITSLGRDEMFIDVENSHTVPVQGVTLEIRVGTTDVSNFRLSGDQDNVFQLEDGRTVVVSLPELQTGMNRFVLSWDN